MVQKKLNYLFINVLFYFLSVSENMDFNGLNKIAGVAQVSKNTPLNSLSEDKVYQIKKTRQIETKKLGKRIVLTISGNRDVFLPEKPNNYLLSKGGSQYAEMERLANKGHLLFQPLGASGMLFSISHNNKKCKFNKSKNYFHNFRR